MPPLEFEFDLRVDAAERPALLADAVAAEVARHVGYAPDLASQVVGEINVAIAEICRAGEPCAVRFRAAGGRLEVRVSAGTHAERRFEHPLPR